MRREELKRDRTLNARTKQFVPALLLAACFGATWSRQLPAQEPAETPATSIADIHPFGTPEVLQEKLLRVRERETFAQRLQASPVGDQDFETLLQLFAEPRDGFLFTAPDLPVQSFRSVLIGQLRKSPAQIQRAWDQMCSVVAAGELQEAMAKSQPRAFEQLAARYPLSRVSLQARLLAATGWVLVDQPEAALRQLEILKQEFSGAVLESELTSRQQSVARWLAQRIKQVSPASSINNLNNLQATNSVSPAWPVAEWTWSEDLWLRAGIPRMMTDQLITSYQTESARSTGEFHNWPVITWGEHCILRTPFRIVAIDQSTGREAWSLPTDTFKPPAKASASPLLMSDETPRSFDNPLRVSGLQTFGALTVDGEFLWFLDHFDVFDGKQQNAFEESLGNPFQLTIDKADRRDERPATRLVAIRRNDQSHLPEVAWTAGAAAEHTYQAVEKISDHPLAQNIIDAATTRTTQKSNRKSETEEPRSENPRSGFEGHRFLSAPVVQDEQLFILSSFAEQTILNCLDRRSGRLEWQQPLSFHDPFEAQRHEVWNPADGSNFCLVSGDTVLCTLADGLMTGARTLDGQLLWAMATSDAPDIQETPLFHMSLDEDRVDSPAVFAPVTNGQVIVCCNPKSSSVKAVDIKTGRIVWQVARRAFGPGDTGNSADLYVAGLLEQQVILIGQRHCRSLDIATGDQQWVAEIPNSSGRAVCGSDHCLIPQSDGPLIMIQLSDGAIVSADDMLVPESGHFPYGALRGDGERIFVSTPVSVTSFKTVSSLFQPEITRQLTDHVPVDDQVILKQAQLLSLAGRRSEAIELLKLAIHEARTHGNERDHRVGQFLAEMTLQRWGEELLANHDTPQNVGNTNQDLTLLAELPLSSDQQLRVALLTLLKRPDVQVEAETVAELSEFPEWKLPVGITGDWKVRPDLLLNIPVRLNGLTQSELDNATLPALRTLASEMVVFPTSDAAEQWYSPLLDQLVRKGELSAAELIVAARLSAYRNDTSKSDRFRYDLERLRSLVIIPGFDPEKIYETFHPPDRSSASLDSAGLQASADIKGDSTPLMHQAWWEMANFERGATISWTPSWMKHRAMLIDGMEGVEFITVDPRDGRFRDRLTLPSALSRDTLAFRQASDGEAVPGLVPLTGSSEIMMISCLVPGRASTLWTRRYRTTESEDQSIEYGPLTASSLIWHFGGVLHCTNPVTGQDLWTRNVPLSAEVEYQPGIKRIFGDDDVTVVMGSDLESYRRFRTRDGQELSSGRLQIGQATETKTFGRFLVYSDFESRIHVFDGATEQDILADEAPINAGSNSLDQVFQLLPEDRVLTVSSDHQIVMIDARAGKVQFRTTVKELVESGSGFVFGVMAFERNGRLFVGLEDNRVRGISGMIGNNRGRDPQLADGLLLSLKPDTGEIQWHQRLDSVVFPEIAGDSTDLMAAWSMTNHVDENGDEQETQILEVQLIDSNTGMVKLKEQIVSSSSPFFCQHIAAESVIELMTRDCTIRFSARPPESP